MRRVNTITTRTSQCNGWALCFSYPLRAAVNLAILASICVFCAFIYCHIIGRYDHRYQASASVESIYEDVHIEPRLFYIYNWSSDITDSWPAGYSHPRLAIEEHFKLNYGAGVAVDTEQGLYHTHQYSLFQLFYHRLLQSGRRTMDPSRASVFFIPYDLGMDGSTRRSDGALIQTNCPNVERVMQLLEISPYFRASGGSNHFTLHSINQMMLYYANEPCLRLYQLCFNCTKLSIDTYSSDVYRFIAENAFMRNKWLSIPFPSNYHISEASSKPPWMDIIVAAAAGASDGTTTQSSIIRYIAEMYSTGRPYTFCFMGTDKVTARLQKQLRIEVRRMCAAYSSRTPDPCLLVTMPSHDSNHHRQRPHYYAANTSSAPILEGDDSSSRMRRNPYRLAKFCFQPGAYTDPAASTHYAFSYYTTAPPHYTTTLYRRGLPYEEGSAGLSAVGLHPGGVRADGCTRAVAAPLELQEDSQQLRGLHPSRHRSEEHVGGVCIPDQIEPRPRVHEQEADGHRRYRPSHAVRPSPQSQYGRRRLQGLLPERRL